MSRGITRRKFLAASGRSAVLSGALAAVARGNALGANERVRMGWIGCGLRGKQLLEHFQHVPGAEIVAGCDVDRSHAEFFKQKAGGKIETYHDFRKLLDRKDIDAVVVATNGHWHCLPMMHACAAGKDVYAEKPLARTIGEGKLMVKAARKYDRIVYFGAQQRHMPHYQEAIAFIHSGKLGKITEVRNWNVENIAPNGFGNPPDGEPPADLDWDFWLGPAPKVRYNPNRIERHYWFWDYGGGWPSEWAVHLNDVTHWAMKVDQPLSSAASGGKFIRKDNAELPDTFEVVHEYPGFITMYSFRHGNGRPIDDMQYGSAFFGENGTLVINRQGWRVLPEPVGPEPELKNKFRMEAKEGPGTSEDPEFAHHQQAFIDAVKAHKISESSDVEIGYNSSIPGHLSNISYRVGRKLHWDTVKGEIKDDPEANKFLTPEYRSPWKLELV